MNITNYYFVVRCYTYNFSMQKTDVKLNWIHFVEKSTHSPYFIIKGKWGKKFSLQHKWVMGFSLSSPTVSFSFAFTVCYRAIAVELGIEHVYTFSTCNFGSLRCRRCCQLASRENSIIHVFLSYHILSVWANHSKWLR